MAATKITLSVLVVCHRHWLGKWIKVGSVFLGKVNI